MSFGLDLNEVIRAIGVLGLLGIIFAETGLLIGFFLPGDTLLFAAGFLTQQGTLGINIHALVLLLIVAASLGYTLSYEFGKRIGPKIFRKPDALFFNHKNLTRAEKFYEKYGVVTIILARFIPVVRTFVPIVAGVSKMNYKTYQLYNLLGGVLWIGSVTYLGYFGGAWLEARGINVEALVMPVILGAVLVSLISPVYHVLREPEGRAMLMRRLGLKRK